tara:strand:- start:294 stop:1403 length:1110 start_codon:yes stop_codon:yes gene_type:complete
MTFISEALYRSLKKEQENLLKQIGDKSDQSTALTSRIKSDEAFLASYDSTTAKLQASIENAEAQVPVIQKRIEDVKNSTSKAKDEVTKTNEQLEDEKKALQKAVTEKEPQSVIDGLNASISVLENKIIDLEKLIDSYKAQLDSLQTQLVDTQELIATSKKQISENAARKDDLEDGGTLEGLKKELVDVDAALAEVNASYKEFISKNQETINAFEAQDERRNQLIQLSSNREIYKRSLPEVENNVIANEDEVLKEVVKIDLDIDNLTDPEKALLAKAIEDAKNSEFDPNFLTADQASDMARTANFSLLPVSHAIKAAAMKGLYSIIVSDLSDSNIYALEQSGYTVILTPNYFPEFEIRWDKIDPIKSEEK